MYVRKATLIDKSRIEKQRIVFQHELPGIDHELNKETSDLGTISPRHRIVPQYI